MQRKMTHASFLQTIDNNIEKQEKKVKIAFYSNFLSHHQLPFCMAMDKLTGGQFTFVATAQMPEEQRNLGYRDMNKEYPFVLTTYDSQENQEKAMELAKNCDIFMIGSAPFVFLQERMKQGKLGFFYSERLYKRGYELWKWPIRLLRLYRTYGRHKQLYLLCASAFTAADFARTGTFVGKTYKWGYFPEVKQQDMEALFAQKKENKRISILWVGRFLELKHPDDVILMAEKLKTQGYDFDLEFIGSGVLEEKMQAMIQEKGLSENVRLLGTMSPEEVREHMESADIYLFTSDRNEGWGAVLNESMNSGCAVVASHAIGSVPFLLNDGENGLIYRSGDVDDLCEKVKALIEDPQLRYRLGENAYTTMEQLWNAEIGAQRLLELAQDLMENKQSNRFAQGPCSPAKIIKDTWHERKNR